MIHVSEKHEVHHFTFDQKDVDKTRNDIAEQNQSNNHILDNYEVHQQIQRQTDDIHKTQQQTYLAQNYQSESNIDF